MLGLTQAELAKSAGISTTGLNNIERNAADPKASTLRAIQSALEEAGIIFQEAGALVDGGPRRSPREEGCLMTSVFNPRDKSRTSQGKTRSSVRKFTSPPRFEDGDGSSSQRWQWLTIELLESAAFTTLSANANRAFFRIIIQHASHAALENGKLVITHPQFVDYGVTGEYVADAVDELAYKGLIKVKRGRAGSGVAHPNLFTLTFVGDFEGAPPTNEWRRCTSARCKQWAEVDRKLAAENRSGVGRKKKSPLRDSEIRPLRDSEMIYIFWGRSAAHEQRRRQSPAVRVEAARMQADTLSNGQPDRPHSRYCSQDARQAHGKERGALPPAGR